MNRRNLKKPKAPLDVVHYVRHSRGGWCFSIERVFQDVRRAMSPDVECREVVSPFESKGIVNRIRNIRHAQQQQGDINHITGDIHYLALGLRSSRTIVSVHDCGRYFALRGLRRLIFRIFWLDWPLRRCAAVTAISEATKKELLNICRWLPADRVRVVPDPVSRCFREAPRSNGGAIPRVLQVGTSPNKNIPRVVAALEGIRCELRIVGRMSSDLRRLLDASGVRWSSAEQLSDEELTREYQDCDLVVFASTYEGFGLPIVEAQASGRPVVTSDLLSMPEVAGEGAVLVNPFEAADIRRGISLILANEDVRDGLVAKGLENVRRFQPDAIARQYRQIYMDVCRANDKGAGHELADVECGR